MSTLIFQLTSTHASEHSAPHYDVELARIDQRLQANITVASQRPDSWLHLEAVAKSYLERAHLTGDFDDYHSALNVMNQIFSISGERAGPALTRATLHFAVHRLPEIESDLLKAESALLVDTPTKQKIQGIRADVLLYTGQYAQAKEAYDQLEAIAPSVNSATRLAHYHAQLAQFQEAERWYERAEQRVTGQSAHLRSWLKLQFGILDLEQGKLDDAIAHYNDGLGVFPDYWLLEEHIAEIDALQGRDKMAEKKYRDLIKRTGSPVFMSALVDILAVRNNKTDQNEAVSLREKTNQWYEDRITKIPELMSGHALSHFLQSGDSQRSLQLAQNNYRLRPAGEAAVQLVQAHTRLGQIPQATRLLKILLTSPYRSAELHATAGVVFQANGDKQKADKHYSLAQAINPLAVGDMDWLLAGVVARYVQ
ncbi:MAG: tetratricopeptide repeat protein [Granulosicoccus sp.]